MTQADAAYVVQRARGGTYYVVNRATGRRVFATFRKQVAKARCVDLNRHVLLRGPQLT